MKPKIYLDNNASTSVDPQVLQTLMTYLGNNYGNPSSQHAYGRNVRGVLTSSRDQIARFLGVKSKEIVFTSGGTEGLNLILQGILEPCHIITSDLEHAAVFETLKALEKRGFQVTYLKGTVTPEAVREALTHQTRWIVLMSVNNETGVKTDIETIASIALQAKVHFLVDAISQLGKEPIKIYEGISAMCFSGQKIHAPMGTGFAFIRSGVKLKPLLFGGEQENCRRAGTENIPGIVALTHAIQLLENQSQLSQRLSNLRDTFEREVQKIFPAVLINEDGPRICNTSNLSFPGIDGEALLTALDMAGIAASHGSACASGALEPSRVLINMGYSKERVRSSIRFSFSRFNTLEEIEIVIQNLLKLLY